MRTLQDLTKTILPSRDLTFSKLKEVEKNSTEKIYVDVGAIATINASLTVIKKAAMNLSKTMAEYENELAMSGTTHRKQEKPEKNIPQQISI